MATFTEEIRAGTNPDSSNAQGRARAEKIRWLAQRVYVCSDALVELKLFTKVRVANRVLYKMALRGELYRVGTYVFPKNGKRRGHPTWIYFGRPAGPRILEHQIFISQILLRMRPNRFKTQDCKYNEDITTVTDDDVRLRWEIDRATEGRTVVQQRLDRFEGCTGLIIFATTTAKRIAKLKTWAAEKAVAEQVYFCLISDVVADPYRTDILEDIHGERFTLYRNRSVEGATSGTPSSP